jgi:hypothetical protein
VRRAADLIRATPAEQDERFARQGIVFPGLFGRRLKLIDCQNLYCEISKYARTAHPGAAGVAGRTRIKQVYRTWPPPGGSAAAVLPAEVAARRVERRGRSSWVVASVSGGRGASQLTTAACAAKATK